MKIFKYLNDFIQSAQTETGYGKFYKNVHAIELAKGMSKTQIKKYKKHKIVPAAFFIWLREAGIVKASIEIPYGGATKTEFLKIFKNNYVQPDYINFPENKGSSPNDTRISKWDTIMLSSVSQYFLWEKLELYGNYKNRAA
jgi:hypothetical protein